MALRDEYRLQSLNHALDVIEALSGSDSDMGVSEISKAIALSKGAVHRILANLAERGYVEARGSGRYRLGLKLWETGANVPRQRRVREAASQHMHDLMEQFNENVLLVIYDRGEVVYLDSIATEEAVRTYSPIGGRSPAHAVASGKVLLAYQSPRERERYLATELVSFTERTITSPQQLEETLEEIRSRGFATNIGEKRLDVNGVAAAIQDSAGAPAAALSISGPAYRFTEDVLEKAAQSLLATTGEISSQLGYSG